MYSNVIVVNNKVRLNLVLNVPEGFLNQSLMEDFCQKMQRQAKGFGLKNLDVSISVVLADPLAVHRVNLSPKSCLQEGSHVVRSQDIYFIR